LSTFSRNGGMLGTMTVDRTGSDGTIMSLQRDGTSQGTISISGTTTSYNAFMGSHWSQLAHNDTGIDSLKLGTVMETIDEMCFWKYDHDLINNTSVLYTGPLNPDETYEDADGNLHKIEEDVNDRLPRSKISTTIKSKSVYGVFFAYDNGDGSEDFLIASLGAGYVRMNADQMPQIGDLVESAGNGCAQIQIDDIVRSSTIGKITATIRTVTYDDGSYVIPCVLYCG